MKKIADWALMGQRIVIVEKPNQFFGPQWLLRSVVKPTKPKEGPFTPPPFHPFNFNPPWNIGEEEDGTANQ